MRFARILKILLVVVPLLLVAVVVGGIAVLKSTDFNQYKTEIAAEVKKATGRDLVIAGDLGVEISLNPAVAVEGVSFTNAEWGSRPEMVTLDRFEARIAVLPLLFGRLEIAQLVLVGADILLEVDKEGRANFAFGGPAEAAPEGEAGQMEIPIGAREVAIEDSVVTYTDAVTGASYQARIDQLTLKGESLDDPVSLVFGGSYNEAPVAATAVLGTPSAMMSPDSPWPVDLTLEAGGAKIVIKGAIAQPATASGIDLAVSVSGAELGDLSALAGAEVPKLGPYALSGKLSGDAASALTFAGFEAGLAGSELAGEINVKLDGKRPAIAATLTSENIDLTALGGGATPWRWTDSRRSMRKYNSRRRPSSSRARDWKTQHWASLSMAETCLSNRSRGHFPAAPWTVRFNWMAARSWPALSRKYRSARSISAGWRRRWPAPTCCKVLPVSMSTSRARGRRWLRSWPA
jgi:uncharacterized protein involved in outer membrane biogenesis